VTALQPGDIYAVAGYGPISTIIKWATWSQYSHIGIISQVGNWPLLFESTSLRSVPCLYAGKTVRGVQVHNAVGIVRDRYPDVTHLYRPVVALDFHEEFRMSRYLWSKIGTPYDYAGAIGTVLFLVRKVFGNTMDRMFCSALVSRALAQAGRFSDDKHILTPGGLIKYAVDNNLYKFVGEVLV
jgi:hypothetical protein